MSSAPDRRSHVAAGQEILVVDKDEQVSRGLQALLGGMGFVVTATGDPVKARDLLVNKFFTVALLDVDSPSPGGGIELLKFAREKSSLTTIIIMTARKSFDVGVAGFRGGAADVIVKEPGTVPYLKDRVLAAADELTTTSDRNSLLEEVAEAHEEFLGRMRELARQRLDLEDRLLGREATQTGGPSDVCTLLVVSDDSDVGTSLTAGLPEAKGWRITLAQTGGEGLDLVNQLRPQIVLVKEPLPDLPARMVVTTARTSAPDAVVLTYEPPTRAGSVGEVKMADGGHMMTLIPSYTSAEQLVAPLDEIREGVRQKMKERRYLQAFRNSNLEFLQRYNSLRQKIHTLLARNRSRSDP